MNLSSVHEQVYQLKARLLGRQASFHEERSCPFVPPISGFVQP